MSQPLTHHDGHRGSSDLLCNQALSGSGGAEGGELGVGRLLVSNEGHAASGDGSGPTDDGGTQGRSLGATDGG